MISSLYELIGRFVVWSLRTRYRTQLRIAGAAGAAVALVAGILLAKRQPPEG